MKSIFTLSAVAVFLLLGCSQSHEHAPLSFKDYPSLKLGMTTQSFTGCIPVTYEAMKGLIEFSHQKGFVYMEIRDAKANLTPEECARLNDHAKSLGIEASYAIQTGILDTDYWDVFERGLANAREFDGPPFFRSPAGGEELNQNETKTGWSEKEFKELVERAAKSGQSCAEHGLQFVVENGYESLWGEEGSRGLGDLLEATGPEVGWQIDNGNFFGVSREKPSVEEVKAIMNRFGEKIGYVHLKASKDGDNLPYLDDNPLPHAYLFEYLAEHDAPYIAIELRCFDDAAETFEHFETSLTYLKEQGFIH